MTWPVGLKASFLLRALASRRGIGFRIRADVREGVMETSPTHSFNRNVAILFGAVLLALSIAAGLRAPLAYDGSYFLFRVLDSRQLMVPHGRIVYIPIQLAALIAAHFSDSVQVIGLIFSGVTASVPALGLLVSWLVCRRRPSLFLWPAIAICIIKLPGLMFFTSQQRLAVTLMWPALLTSLVGAAPATLASVAILALVGTLSHPNTAILLLIALFAAIANAKVRPTRRKQSLWFGSFLLLLLIVRIAIPLDVWEKSSLTSIVVRSSFYNAVLGWPLVGIAAALLASLSCLLPGRRSGGILLILPLIVAGLALILWAIRVENWASCIDYRYWDAPFSMLLMAGAIVDGLRSDSAELERQSARLYAFPVIGATFLAVLSIQSVEWKQIGDQLRAQLVGDASGCEAANSVDWLQRTPLDHWSLTFYAVELQGRAPATLLLPTLLDCQRFAHSGDAVMALQDEFQYVRTRRAGWFNFEPAMANAHSAKP